MKLQQEMGLKSPILEELGTLGTREIAVVLVSLSKDPDLNKDLMAETSSLPTIDQAFLKNPAE